MGNVDTPQVIVRRLGPADLNTVVSCASLLPESPTVEWAEDFFARGASHLYVAFAGNSPVGLLAATELPSLGASPDLYIYLISVDPAHRGHGVGSRLVERAVEAAEETGFAHVRMAVLPPIDPNSSATAAATRPWRIDERHSLVITLE